MRTRARAATIDASRVGSGTVRVHDGLRLVPAPSWPIGTVCIIAGGLVAAVTAAAPSERASWAAGYLVLVGGVAQIALATGQAAFDRRVTAPTWARAVAAGWSTGNALVLGGTLAGLSVVTDAGGVLLLATLVLVLPGLRAPAPPRSAVSRWLLLGYRGLVVLLLASVPVGLVLAGLR